MNVKKPVTVVLYCLGLCLLLGLGTWQLNRGLHKAAVVSLLTTELKEYQSLEEIPNDLIKLDYSKATLSGEWLPEHFFLLDNRIYQGQPGYEVLTPFRLHRGQVLLVNRGWISQAGMATKQLPPLDPALLPQGTLYLPKKGFTLGNAIQNAQDWPVKTLYLDLPALSADLQQPLAPLVLVLDGADGNSLTRIWKAVVVTPERHYAYAAQWFGLALVFIVFGFIWRKKL
ncbi:MAG: SURF1 family protein [Thiolinea sp.]